MNLKFPLLNLISRGHIPVTNKVSAYNFVKNLDEGPATRICFEALCCGNDRESAILIEQAQHAFLKEFNVLKMNLTDNQFAQQRDMILLREDSNDRQDQTVSQDPARQFMAMLRTGGMAAAAAWLISRPKQQQEDIKRSLKSIYPTVYNTLQNNYIGRMVGMPDDNGELWSRLAKASVGNKKKNGDSWLEPRDKERVSNYFKKIAKRGGIAIAIAGGITAAIAAISILYKRFFSAAAKECNHLVGKARTICMTKARIKAAEAAIKESEEGLLNCSSAKNEEDCIFKMKVEIRSWKKKKMIEEEKLRKLTNVNKSAFEDNQSSDPFAS